MDWTQTPRYQAIQGLLGVPGSQSPTDIYQDTVARLSGLPAPSQAEYRIDPVTRADALANVDALGSAATGGLLDDGLPQSSAPMSMAQASAVQGVMGLLGFSPVGAAISVANAVNQGAPLGTAVGHALGTVSDMALIQAVMENNPAFNPSSGVGFGFDGYGDLDAANSFGGMNASGYEGMSGGWGGQSGASASGVGMGGNLMGGGSSDDNDGVAGAMGW